MNIEIELVEQDVKDLIFEASMRQYVLKKKIASDFRWTWGTIAGDHITVILEHKTPPSMKLHVEVSVSSLIDIAISKIKSEIGLELNKEKMVGFRISADKNQSGCHIQLHNICGIVQGGDE